MGYMSDRYGRKPMIVLSLVGSSIGLDCCVYISEIGAIAQGLSSSIRSLIICRTLTGLFAGSWIVAQAYVT